MEHTALIPLKKEPVTAEEISREIGLLNAQNGNLMGMLTSVGAGFPTQAQASTVQRITHIVERIAELEARLAAAA